jgi:epoxyqueuosine reductase
MTLQSQIVEEAHALGFVKIGFAAVDHSLAQAELTAWLAKGYGAGMEFLSRHAPVREDPRHIEPRARTVIVAAARYAVNPSPGAGGFSFYASCLDYHEVLRAKLEQLSAFLKQGGVFHARICVDSAPLSEREWAVRAGIGWIGRQGQVINPDFGGCLLLGAILTDADLPATMAQADRCGKCRRCVDACPTRAIGEDRLLDARRCISYLTIEHKGEIPVELRPLMGGAIFGCDRCVAVCPWNRFGAASVMPEFRPRPMPSAEECLRMNESEFRARFAHTNVLRTGLERLQRNAAVALGNTGSPAALPALQRAAETGSEMLRTHARWAIARIEETRS